ncbi:uncharacterized protein BDZ83DRAFT_217735 [Colletotrichum acutatum]|uniref:Uncharacterized protein n=1 Tax=Glomerella acutata TaxID=27357 RepID=A0AAD8UTQ3_GLOAC|nr:uncharacterized protein BDZ83DRAFT_217735 [Colletotrichum acutatum]KAK1727151.1 hypothetical protein BDZ83DRAFT_217735 [Colletotrichum acutatum]
MMGLEHNHGGMRCVVSGPYCGLPSHERQTPSSDGMQTQAALFDGSVVAFDIPPFLLTAFLTPQLCLCFSPHLASCPYLGHLMMNYSSVTCFLSIPATLSAHSYPFLQRVLAGGVTFTRQTGPINDSSKSRHYQGSGIVRYGGAWRGSLFPWFPARKKKVSYGTLSLAPAPQCWPAPRYITLAATPRSSSSIRSDTPVDSPLPPIARFARFARSHTSHTLPLPPPCNICPWHRGPRQILGRLFLM